MERLTSLQPMPDHLRGSVMALGNFDGVHLGHQAVIGRAVARARAEGRPVIVATFDPHPIRLFRPDAPPFALTTLDQRADLFAALGADAMLVFAFNAEMARHGPEDFVTLLARDMGVSAVVTGEDFTFGRGRAGNIETFRTLGAPLGLDAEAIAPVTDATGEIVSSSRIRAALVAGDCALATRLLTRPFAIASEVVHGDALGREIGFPTANMLLGDYLRPAYGVYAVRVRLPDGRLMGGAANLGIRPMFDPPKELLETYILDFSGKLYGETIEISLIERLRGEVKYESLDRLVDQLHADVAQARQILAAAARIA